MNIYKEEKGISSHHDLPLMLMMITRQKKGKYIIFTNVIISRYRIAQDDIIVTTQSLKKLNIGYCVNDDITNNHPFQPDNIYELRLKVISQVDYVFIIIILLNYARKKVYYS